MLFERSLPKTVIASPRISPILMSVFLQRIIRVFAISIFATAAHAVEILGAPQVQTATDSATIMWRTDVACGTRIQYGLNTAQLGQKAEGSVASAHEITLRGLAPGTTYYFRVGSARTQLAGGSFTTLGAASAATPTPSILRRVLSAILPGEKPPAPAATPTAPTTPAPPTRQTWGHLDSLQDHFDRHGRDFKAVSPDDYAAQAWRFLQRARSTSLPMKLDDTDGTLRVFDPSTRAFAAYNSAGKTKTYFKPESASYWQRQPGRVVKPSDLRFPTR